MFNDVTIRVGVVAVGLVAGGAWAATPAATSLNNCQNAVKVATKAFVTNKVMAIGTCLQAVSTQIVKNNAPDAHAAAGTCVTQFRKLNDSRGQGKQLSDKLAAAIVKKCDPSYQTPGGSFPNTHTLADIIGAGAGVPQPLNAENLNAWCTHYGGDGSIDSLPEWIDCLTAAAECAVDSSLASQYPRVLEWLNLVKPSMQALSPPAMDSSKITDAVAGLSAVKAEIDGPNNDNLVSIQCGGPGSFAQRFTDNGNGTLTDHQTGLMWERKSPSGTGGVHDVDNVYTWCNGTFPDCANPSDPPDGTAFTTFLYGLNGGTSPDGIATSGCFAGYCDWRVPTIEELKGIVDATQGFCGGGDGACIDPAFGPAQPFNYWSATSDAGDSGNAWVVGFTEGSALTSTKTDDSYVRAVRGASSPQTVTPPPSPTTTATAVPTTTPTSTPPNATVTPTMTAPAGPAGSACSANNQCSSGQCGAFGSGHCCAAACTVGGICGATDCNGTGACVYPPFGTTAPGQTAGNCQSLVCNGAGGVTSVDDASDLPTASTVCLQNPACSGPSPLHPTFTNAPAGTDCTADSHLPKHVCGDGAFAGSCVECNSTADCSGALVCNASHVCQ